MLVTAYQHSCVRMKFYNYRWVVRLISDVGKAAVSREWFKTLIFSPCHLYVYVNENSVLHKIKYS
jgi:hypothetical protein